MGTGDETDAPNDTPVWPNTFWPEAGISTLKALISIVPGAGGFTAEMIGFAGQRYMAHRQEQFLKEVFERFDARLGALEVRLAEPSAVIWSMVFHTTEVATRTYELEKLAALRNELLNSSGPSAPEDDLQHIFVNMVADLTAMHLRLLKFILYPQTFPGVDVEDWRGIQGSQFSRPDRVWKLIAAHVHRRRDIIGACLNDLVNRNLFDV